jgi:hypothetical protein
LHRNLCGLCVEILVSLFVDELADFGGDEGWIDFGSGLAGFDGRPCHCFCYSRGNAEIGAFGDNPIGPQCFIVYQPGNSFGCRNILLVGYFSVVFFILNA